MDPTIEAYLNLHFSIIPVYPNTKKPACDWKDFQDRRASQDELAGWFDPPSNYNVGIVTGEISRLVVLDIDGDEGVESLKSFGELPRTPTVKTSRGHHYYFRHPGCWVTTKSGVRPGLDIKGDSGMVIAPPSIHPSGHRYEWLFSFDDAPLSDMPGWLLELTTKKDLISNIPSGPTDSDNPDLEVDLNRVEQALRVIPADDRQTWITVGMALHDATGGSTEGYRIWTDWSRPSQKFNAKEQRRQYTSFQTARADKVTLASVFKLARDHGWDGTVGLEWNLPQPKERPETRTEITREVGDVTSRAMPAVKRRFREYRHYPSEKHWDGLEQIALTIQAMATENPVLRRDFIVSFLPPGMGKTTTVVETVRLLPPNIGAVIFLSRCEEIEKLAKGMGLSDEQFSVIVSDRYPDIAKLGNPDPKKARVLFTTQQMLEARVKGDRKFRDVSEFWFDGGPRAVRIWDEAILPSSLYTLGRYDITNMLKPCQTNGYPKLGETLEAFYAILKAAKDRAIVTVPEIVGPGLEEMRSWFDHEDDREACETLFKLSGRSCRVRRDQGGNAALHYEDTFPEDLGPMLILDASGKQRSVYEHWYSHRKGLKFLPSPQKVYSGLTIHHWDRGAGRTTFQPKRKEWRDIVEGVAKVIRAIPRLEPVLVVHLKPGPFIVNIERELRGRLGDCENVSFLTWGKHTATNEFQNCKHVILAGVLQYSVPQNEAVGRMAKRLLTDDELSELDYQSIRLGEIAHNIFQAACRGHVRKSVEDRCPPGCHLYIIFSTHMATGIPRELLRDIFPGAAIDDWLPALRVGGKKQKEFIAYLLRSYDDGKTRIDKAGLITELSLKDKYYLDRLLDDPKIIKYMTNTGIEYQHDGNQIRLNGQQFPQNGLEAVA